MKDLVHFARDLWALTKPYWFSEDRWAARGLLAVIVALNLGIVYLNVLFNEWYNVFYNALQDKDWDIFVAQILRFSWLAALFIIVAVYRLYLNQMLQIRWRRWLTDRYLTDWLAHRVYYRMQLTDSGTDNPDQRISEDLRLFTTRTLQLSLGLMSAVVTLFSFLAILWTLSGDLVVPLGGGMSVTVPGYMVWVAFVYAMIGTWLAHKIGQPLIALNFNQQRVEADFRFGLVRFRENAEGIALYRGEADEHRSFRQRFAAVYANWYNLMRMQKRLTWLTAGYSQVAVIFPFVVAAPRYFSGAIQLGGLMQISSTFGQVQESLSFIVTTYSEIADWKAVVDRLLGFEQAIIRARTQAMDSPGIRVEAQDGSGIAVSDLALELPNATPLLNRASLAVEPGAHVLLTGPSGSGKSTLFRALAGIWPFGRGQVAIPRGARTLFLPQKPYLPIGTLRDVLCYPDAGGTHDDATLREALAAVRLPLLIERLDEAGHWANRLSPGEQQRIAVARALLLKPDWLFLDEATSAVDEEIEHALYALLRQRLPRTTIVSIGHRPTLAAFHERRITIARDGDGRGSLVEALPAAAS
ncbi:MAG: ABC transporter ATP-binding protein/permease [Proteobacteria bacterium]|nr:ABC transporter ATP-binding protein/permease [Pseudomonadota bacterium]